MALEEGLDQDILQVFRLPDSTVIRPVVAIDNEGNFVDLTKVRITDGTTIAPLNSQGHQLVTQDTQTLVLNRFVARFDVHSSTLSAPTSIGATSIDIAGNYGDFAVGQSLFLFDPTTNAEENSFPIITATPGSPTLTLNKPLDKAYSNGSIVQHVITNIFDTAGTLGAPVSYKLFPPPGVSFYIRGGAGMMRMDNPGDYSAFGDIAGGITNGVVSRVSLNGVFTTLVTLRQNSDFELDTSRNLQFVPNAGPGPGGDNGVVFTYIIADWGTYVVLNGDNNTNPLAPLDFFEVLVQDDLTAVTTTLTDGFFKVHGYVVINS